MYGQMNEPPGARARVALTGLTVAEYFRDKEGKDVLLFIDNIFRFTQAGSEVGGRRAMYIHVPRHFKHACTCISLCGLIALEEGIICRDP